MKTFDSQSDGLERFCQDCFSYRLFSGKAKENSDWLKDTPKNRSI
jgi:hypothetical protein